MSIAANWPVVAMVVAALVVIALLLAYLFKTGTIGKAKVAVGVDKFAFKLDLESKEWQIIEQDFKRVNLDDFYADSDVGLVIRKPLSKEWALKKATLREIVEEKGFTEDFKKSILERVSLFIEDPAENVHVLTIRRGAAQSIRYTGKTMIDGAQRDFKKVKSLLKRDEEIVYDQINIFAYNKEAVKGRISLLDFFFIESQFARGVGPRRLSVNPENTVFLLDCSALFEKVIYNGKLGDHIINNMFLFQENDQYFFEVILSYIQSDDKPTKVWEELGAYLHSFHVLTR